MIRDLIRKNRSYRRFLESDRIHPEQLLQWIDLARLSPSSRNQQALKFIPVNQLADCNKLFPNLAWAGYLSAWDGPEPGERPSAYIVVLGDTKLGTPFQTDLGIAAQSILLGATADGYGGCMIGSVKRKEVQKLFDIEDHLQILLVIALGRPAEEVRLEEVKEDDIRYWRDDQGVHHVPKRSIQDVVINIC